MQYLTETVVKDLIDFIDMLKDNDADGIFNFFKSSRGKYNKSIASKSRDLVMTFPVLCSNSMSPETANMISKALERKEVTMMQLIFASEIINNYDSVQDYVTQNHHNIGAGGMDIDKFIDVSDKVNDFMDGIGESGTLIKKTTSYIEQSVRKQMLEELAHLDYDFVFESSINDRSLCDYRIINPMSDNPILIETALNIDDEQPITLIEAKEKSSKRHKPSRPTDRSTTTGRGHNISTNDDDSKIASNITTAIKNTYDSFQKQLLPSDCKKANELVPSMMIVRYNIKTGDNDNKIETAIIGIKSRLIPVASMDIVEHIFTKTTDSNWVLKLIRATTKEISFCKDFLLALDKAKIDAMSNSRRGSSSRMWKILERRSLKSKINGAIRRTNDASAITTIAITQEEVEYMKKNYNIDIENVTVASTILDAYNLLAIVIVDESLEIAKFLYDGDGEYEQVSFTNLERETGDGSYKKVINLMSKFNR